MDKKSDIKYHFIHRVCGCVCVRRKTALGAEVTLHNMLPANVGVCPSIHYFLETYCLQVHVSAFHSLCIYIYIYMCVKS